MSDELQQRIYPEDERLRAIENNPDRRMTRDEWEREESAARQAAHKRHESVAHDREVQQEYDKKRKQRHKPWGKILLWIAVAVVVLLLIFLVGYLPRHSRNKKIAAEAADREREHPQVEVIRVAETHAPGELTVPGTTSALTEAYLYARANGYIRKRYVDIGDHVVKGQLMAILDAPDLDQQVDQARQQLRQAEAQVGQQKAQLDLTRVTWERWRTLVAKGVFSRQDGDQRETDYRAQQAIVASAERNVESYRANLLRAIALQSYERITAPFTGIVTQRNADVGALVGSSGSAMSAPNPTPQTPAGGTTAPASANTNGTSGMANTTSMASQGTSQGGPIFAVAQIDTLRILVAVPEGYATSVHPGMAAKVFLQERPNVPFDGTVARLANSLDQNTRTMLTEVDVDNRNHTLYPGMYAVVEFQQLRGTAPLTVPGDAVIVRNDQTSVATVVDGNRVQLRPVQIGRDYGPSVEIVGGLRPGDTVITSVTDGVQQGATVEPRLNKIAGEQATGNVPQPQTAKEPDAGPNQYGDQSIVNQTSEGTNNQGKKGQANGTAHQGQNAKGVWTAVEAKRERQLRWTASVFAVLGSGGYMLAQQATPPVPPPYTAPAPAGAAQDQNGPQQPPPYTAPQLRTPAAPESPGQQQAPQQQRPEVSPAGSPDAPLPQPDASSIDLRALRPLAAQTPAPVGADPQTKAAATTSAAPSREGYGRLQTSPIRLIAPYKAAHVPALSPGNSERIGPLIRDGKLYLSLRDAVELAVENNLDVEVSRYDLLLADTDVLRAAGGGNLRGVDTVISQTAPGVGSITSPLLNTATTGTASPVTVQVTDLSQVTQTGSTAQQSLSQNGTSTYAAGPAIPLFDPQVTAEAGYLRRSDQTSLISDTTTGTATGGTAAAGSSGTAVASPPLNFINTGVDYQQGFSFGGQLEAFVSNAPQVLYGDGSQYDPFHAPSTSATFTQPLLRGRGRGVNLRFIRIANVDKQVSRLVFEQQLLETVYGISRLYYDLVSLGENIGVKEEALAAAQRLYDDDHAQVEQGTLAPIELTRVQALLSGSRLDLIQARSEYRQQEVILREQVLRSLTDPAARFASIVPTDHIAVPATAPVLDVPALTADALNTRPDLAQAALQVQANEISAKATANSVRPLLNVYANVQTRGTSLVPYQTLGSAGTGQLQVPAALTQGGLRLSTIYQGGIQLNLPLRNRIAQADAARDAVQLRQSQGRTAKLENDVRQQVENASIALESAHQAYGAAVESRNYQQQLLQAEIDKFSVGASTNFLIVQDEAYLAQARSTEVAARSDYMKAQLSLDRALGDSCGKNGIALDDAIEGTAASERGGAVAAGIAAALSGSWVRIVAADCAGLLRTGDDLRTPLHQHQRVGAIRVAAVTRERYAESNHRKSAGL